jgi:hypothetical protein
MDKITFGNKVDTKVTSVAEINKVTGTNLNEIKSVTNLAVEQIVNNKEDITSLINGNGKIYVSVSNAMAVLPLPSDNTPFTVRDSVSNLEDGYYIYLSTEVGGYKFLQALQALANGYYVINSLLDFDSLISNASSGVWMVISDITLDANKTIPSGVTLQFRNAKINLGGFTLTGTNTKIDAGLTQIFDTNGNIDGTINAEYININWFGAIGGNSTVDNPSIQKAIDIGASQKIQVHIYPSLSGLPYRYTEIVNKGILIGKGGVLKLDDNVGVDALEAYYTFHNFNGASRVDMLDDCEYINLIIDGNGINNTSFLVLDILTAGGKNIVVRGNKMIDAADSAIMLTFAENGICEQNNINGATDLGIYINDNENGLNSFGSRTTGNIITKCVFGGIAIKRGTMRHKINDNYVYDCGNGITHESFGTGLGGHPEGISIENNTIDLIGYNYRTSSLAEVGIQLSQFDNGKCSDNKIMRVSGTGIQVDGDSFIIDGNMITPDTVDRLKPDAKGSQGIYVLNRGGILNTNGIINNNQCIGFRDHALRFSSCTGVQVIGGKYTTTNLTAVRVEALVLGLVMQGVTAKSELSLDFELFSGSQFNIFKCLSLSTGFGSFDQSLGLDFKKESNGIAVMTGATGVSITHGLDGTPTKFNAHASVDSYWWVETRNSTSITFRANTAITGNLYWEASI